MATVYTISFSEGAAARIASRKRKDAAAAFFWKKMYDAASSFGKLDSKNTVEKMNEAMAKFEDGSDFVKFTVPTTDKTVVIEKVTKAGSAKNPKRKFSAKQIAAQKRFAAAARSGKLRKRKVPTKRKSVRKNPSEGLYLVERKIPRSNLRYFVHSVYYRDSDRPSIGRGISYTVKRDAAKRFSLPEAERVVEFSKREFGERLIIITERRSAMKNPARSRQFGKKELVIRATRPVKTGYKYYYLREDQFVIDPRYADKFSRKHGEKRMREIVAKLPPTIQSITLVKP